MNTSLIKAGSDVLDCKSLLISDPKEPEEVSFSDCANILAIMDELIKGLTVILA